MRHQKPKLNTLDYMMMLAVVVLFSISSVNIYYNIPLTEHEAK